MIKRFVATAVLCSLFFVASTAVSSEMQRDNYADYMTLEEFFLLERQELEDIVAELCAMDSTVSATIGIVGSGDANLKFYEGAEYEHQIFQNKGLMQKISRLFWLEEYHVVTVEKNNDMVLFQVYFGTDRLYEFIFYIDKMNPEIGEFEDNMLTEQWCLKTRHFV